MSRPFVTTLSAFVLALFAFIPSDMVAQATALQRGSDNIDVLGHLPLGPTLSVLDMDVEQEMSRPYAYVSRMVWADGGAKGMDIVSLEDPSHPELIYEWRQIETLRNLFGANGRPSPAQILDLTKRVMAGETPSLI